MKHFKNGERILLGVGLMLMALMLHAIDAQAGNKTLIDFSSPEAAGQWVSVNDNVMGGVSKGGFRITGESTLEFSGSLSLDNNGGFTSIRTRPADLGLEEVDTIVVRVKGDGRTYYFTLRTGGQAGATNYQAPVKTQNNKWEEFRLAIADFDYTAFGRRLGSAANLKTGNIRSVGFTLADKKAGSFRLEIDWIRAEKSTALSGAASANNDIVDTAVASGQFKTLVAAVKAAGLVEKLKGDGPLTVFAPNDDAFAKLPEGTVEGLLKPESRDKLVSILSYHVVPGELRLGTLSPVTLQGESMEIKASGQFEVNGVMIVSPDIETANGIIHVIDRVLMPPKTSMTPAEAARAVIELAISRGVPLFNSGQTAACAAVYEVTAESLVSSHAKVLGDNNRKILLKALSEMRGNKDDPRAQAWTLRYALDSVYTSLSE